MLNYLYKGSYYGGNYAATTSEELAEVMSTHIGMYALADKYDVSELRSSAVEEYKNCLPRQCKFAAVWTRSDIEAFFATVPQVFQSASEGWAKLQEAAIELTCKYVHCDGTNPDIDGKIKALFQEIPSYAWGVFSRLRQVANSKCHSRVKTPCPLCK